ncbi:MAG TPA: signal recognition particle-docking protein FtsY [Acidimicrobiales bacterium]|nr:signal recognition particle-docking protein FtsY [Acidimicrobiales bacterium]
MEVVILLIALLVLSGSVLGMMLARGRARGDDALDPVEEAGPSDVAAPDEVAGAPDSGTTDLDEAELNEPSSGVGLAPRPGEPPPAEDDADGPGVDPDDATVAEIEEALAQAVEDEQAEALKPRFRDRLAKARSLLAGYVGSVLSRSTIDDETWDELEEALIRADVGMGVTALVLDALRAEVSDKNITDPEALLAQLKGDLKARLAEGDRALHFEAGAPNVWLFVGVNGVGKTTTIGKLGKRCQEEGRRVVMAAGDTFRAAAAEQLGIWAERTGATLVQGVEGGDPSSVVFDAVQKAAATGADLVLADTAGRLHTKVNLMEQLSKVRRVAGKPPGRVTEVLLVLDATTGQNGLTQAQQFTEAVEVTGVVLTKLDGSAKGGIVLAIQGQLGIPVKLVGLGETVDDLVPFDPDDFVEALLGE